MPKSVRKPKAKPRPKSNITFQVLVEEVGKLGLELTSQLQPKLIASVMANRLVERYPVAVCGVWTINEANSELE